VNAGLEKLQPLFKPIYEALLERNRLSKYQQADETRWLMFVAREGKTGYRWWLWVFIGDDTVVYKLDPFRSRQVPQKHFPEGAKIVLMVDRLSSYKAMSQVKAGTILLAFCWAHVRRDFISTAKSFPELKEWAIDWLKSIRQAYRCNRQRLKHEKGTPEFAAADVELRKVMEVMQAKAAEQLADPKLRKPCRKVLKSLQEHWIGLTRFVDDSWIPMDNNFSERKMRGPALGRKNYYGSGSEWSGMLATMLFSLFATLQKWKINPRHWLKWYFDACAANGGKAPNDIQAFLPWNLSEAQRKTLSEPIPPQECKVISDSS
jgi:transposase